MFNYFIFVFIIGDLVYRYTGYSVNAHIDMEIIDVTKMYALCWGSEVA